MDGNGKTGKSFFRRADANSFSTRPEYRSGCLHTSMGSEFGCVEEASVEVLCYAHLHFQTILEQEEENKPKTAQEYKLSLGCPLLYLLKLMEHNLNLRSSSLSLVI
jgi:hypothetical protein